MIRSSRPILLALVLSTTLFVASASRAATIRNCLSQSLLIQLSGGRSLHLVPRGTAQLSSDDLSSPSVQSLIARGSVTVLADTSSSAAPPEATPTPTPTSPSTSSSKPADAPAPPRFEGTWRFTAPPAAA